MECCGVFTKHIQLNDPGLLSQKGGHKHPADSTVASGFFDTNVRNIGNGLPFGIFSEKRFEITVVAILNINT